MAEDEITGAANVPGLSSDDIIPQIYEGGFKSWECSIDLAKYLLDTRQQLGHSWSNLTIVEVSTYAQAT